MDLTISNASLAADSDPNTDTVPQDSSTTTVLIAGTTSTGYVNTARDRDWYAFNASAGTSYTFTLDSDHSEGDGLNDPFLYIHDDQGNRLAEEDDAGPGLNSKLLLRFETDVTLDVSAASYGSHVGKYALNASLTHEIVGTDGDGVLEGDDLVDAGRGADFVTMGTGDDIFYDHHQPAGDTVYGGNGHDSIYGSGSENWFYGEEGNDYIHGGLGNDAIRGGALKDRLFGGDGDDFLNGNTGHDVAKGQAGDDYILGEGDNDTLRGGRDDDRLEGGGGADQFVFLAEGWDLDRIRDFKDGLDMIVMTLPTGASGFADLTIQKRDGNTAIFWTGNADDVIWLNHIDHSLITGADFIFV